MTPVRWWRALRRAWLAENVKQARQDYDNAQWLGEKMVRHIERVRAERALAAYDAAHPEEGK